MDKDRAKGKIEDIKGRLERQVGEWTGDKDAQEKGTADQVKGKVQSAFGKVKQAGREVAEKIKDRKRHDEEVPRDDRKDEVA